MLASPNCNGVVWLLVQHVEVLGRKKVEGITVWDSSEFEGDAGFQANILVEVGNV